MLYFSYTPTHVSCLIEYSYKVSINVKEALLTIDEGLARSVQTKLVRGLDISVIQEEILKNTPIKICGRQPLKNLEWPRDILGNLRIRISDPWEKSGTRKRFEILFWFETSRKSLFRRGGEVASASVSKSMCLFTSQKMPFYFQKYPFIFQNCLFIS